MVEENHLLKMKKSLFIIFVCSSFIAKAQGPTKVTSFDTINTVQAKIFQYIQSNIDKISLHNFEKIQKGLSKTIYYVNKDTVEKFYKKLFQNTDLKYFVELTLPGTVIKIDSIGRKLSFKEKRFARKKKEYCYLLIFPLIHSKNKIYCHLKTKSENVRGTIYMGDFYFAFNDKMELIKVNYVDSIID